MYTPNETKFNCKEHKITYNSAPMTATKHHGEVLVEQLKLLMSVEM